MVICGEKECDDQIQPDNEKGGARCRYTRPGGEDLEIRQERHGSMT